MKQIRFGILVLILFVAISNVANAQREVDTAQLLGSWVLEKQIFLEPDEDSVYIRKESLGSIVSFEKGNKFRTSKRSGTTTRVIGTGNYTLDAKNRHLVQNDTECTIVELTNHSLILRIEESVELYFKKIEASTLHH